MDDADYIRETTLAYGAVMNLMDRIVSLAEGWEEILDMIEETFEEEYNERNPEKIFTTIYQFLFRVYLRLKTNPNKREFNITTIENNNVKEWVRITNYDFNTFKWVKENGFISGLTNDFVDIPFEKLNEKQIKAFKKKAEKRNND